MSKVPNPVRGYVTCPVCSDTATVHMIGEGRLIAEGEPPKNPRNLGLLYYRCPNCGNSQMSKSVNQYIDDHMTENEPETVNTPLALETASDKALEPVVDNALSDIETPLPEAVQALDNTPLSAANDDELIPVKTAVAPTPKPNRIGMKLAIGFTVILLLVFGLHMALKSQSKEEVAANE
ncbi:hypothetical protein [Vibrio cionasavignyae]|uniref:hypothetical protein n=1 Tax=Vibrio cionasavignyae TaxID=2910252 RepID=UPI003D13F6DE